MYLCIVSTIETCGLFLKNSTYILRTRIILSFFNKDWIHITLLHFFLYFYLCFLANVIPVASKDLFCMIYQKSLCVFLWHVNHKIINMVGTQITVLLYRICYALKRIFTFFLYVYFIQFSYYFLLHEAPPLSFSLWLLAHSITFLVTCSVSPGVSCSCAE